jgi:pimeloyl-ACP methyl ester carboxylesterase
VTTVRTGHVDAPGGRRLAYRDAGDPAVAAVVSHHGTPGSRLDRHPDQEAMLAELGVRVVSYDRPGYGESDPHPGRRVVDAAADVAAVADALGIGRFSVVGTSGGGPHALACSARLADRIDRVGVVVGGAPSDDPAFDFLAGMGPLNVAEFTAAADSEATLAAFLEPYVEGFRRDPDAILDEIAAELPEPDRRVFSRPEHRAITKESFTESIRQGAAGWIADDRAFMSGWGFALSEAVCETRLWQGEEDVLVPRAHCAYLAAHLPHARFDVIPGAGHALADHQREILAWVAGGPPPEGRRADVVAGA